MKDPDIQSLVNLIQASIDNINTAMEVLYNKDVEIKLVFNEAKVDKIPNLYIWKAIEHIDYVKAPL